MSFRVQYRPMLRLRTRHQLVSGNTTRDLTDSHYFRFEPSPGTLTLCKAHGLILKPRADGIDISYKYHPRLGDQALHNPLRGSQRFTFLVRAQHPRSAELWLKLGSAQGKQLYCHNRNGNQLLATNSTLASMVADFTNLQPSFQPTRLVYLKLRPGRFTFPTAKQANNNYPYTGLIVKDAEQKGVADLAIPLDTTNTPTTINSTVEVTSFPLGRYTITDNSNNTLQEIYLSDELYNGAPVGVIDLFWEGPQRSEQINPDAPLEFKTYDLLLQEKR